MATDATGTPTSLGIPKYDTSTDAPSGLGFNAAMDAIDTLIGARIPKSLVTTAGDLIYASGPSTPARLPIGSSGQFLTVAGGVPAWAPPVIGMTNPMTTSQDLIVGGASGAPGRIAIGANGKAVRAVGGAVIWEAPAFAKASGLNPAGVAATGGAVAAVQLGLGSSVSITPKVTGNLIVLVNGNFAGGYTNTTATYAISHGTGAAPANGAAASGTVDTTPVSVGATSASLCLAGGISGLTVGTAYWIDVQEALTSSQVGQTPAIGNVTVTVLEVA